MPCSAGDALEAAGGADGGSVEEQERAIQAIPTTPAGHTADLHTLGSFDPSPKSTRFFLHSIMDPQKVFAQLH